METRQKEGLPLERAVILDPGVNPLETLTGPEWSWATDLSQVKALRPAWVVATPRDTAVELLREVLPWGNKVLVKKPLGLNLAEAGGIAAMMIIRNSCGWNSTTSFSRAWPHSWPMSVRARLAA
jgi:hypothetical protein